jgi:branched-chain amino acid transport system permease protein
LAYALQQLINGITLGMIYGLIAVGYTMVYGIIGMINFAHGDVFMVGSFLSLIAILGLAALGITSVPLALVLTLLFAAAIAALYGWTVERVAYRPLRGSFRLAPLISAIGMSITLQNFVQVSQGARVKPINAIIPGGIQLMDQGGFAVQLSWMQIAIVVITLTILAIFTWLVTRTPLGRTMRACEQDLKMASLLGIDTDQTISLTFVIGAALAAGIEKARFWLDAINLTARADDPAGALPYGAQRRLEIARAMCIDPVLLCLDEPAAGLNPRESEELNQLLLRIRDLGCSLLLIEHDMGVVMRISDHIVVLDHGKKISDGTPAEIRADPAVIAAYLGEGEEDEVTA